MRASGAGERVFDNRDGFDYGAAPKTQLAALLGFGGLSLLAWMASASVAAANPNSWYATLARLTPAPPAAMLSRIWAVLALLYLAMGFGAWLLWRRPVPGRQQRVAMQCWGWLLAFGAAWPAVFFGLHLLLPGLVVAVGTVGFALLTLWRFAPLDRKAALLVAPFCAYTLCALYLNSGFWWFGH